MSDEPENYSPVFGANFKRDADGNPIERGIGAPTAEQRAAAAREKLQTSELILKLEPGLLRALHIGAANARQTVHTFASDILSKGMPAQRRA
jgi:hypothetical protein